MVNIDYNINNKLLELNLLLPGKVSKFKQAVIELIDYLNTNVDGFELVYNQNYDSYHDTFGEYLYKDFPNKNTSVNDHKLMYMYYIVPLIGMITSNLIEMYKDDAVKSDHFEWIAWSLIGILEIIEVMRIDYRLDLRMTALK